MDKVKYIHSKQFRYELEEISSYLKARKLRDIGARYADMQRKIVADYPGIKHEQRYGVIKTLLLQMDAISDVNNALINFVTWLVGDGWEIVCPRDPDTLVSSAIAISRHSPYFSEFIGTVLDNRSVAPTRAEIYTIATVPWCSQTLLKSIALSIIKKIVDGRVDNALQSPGFWRSDEMAKFMHANGVTILHGVVTVWRPSADDDEEEKPPKRAKLENHNNNNNK